MIFNKKDWEEIAKGFTVYDCAFRTPTTQVFVLKEDVEHLDPLPLTRFLIVSTDPKPAFWCKQFNYFHATHIACDTDSKEAVMIDSYTNVYAYDGTREGRESAYPNELTGSDLHGVASNIKRIGSSVYLIGGPRQFYKRLGLDSWQNKADSIELPEGYHSDGPDLVKLVSNTGWRDADGFSENEVYAVGGLGDVWHFSGRDWQQCDFPSNELLHNVCCAGDGNVYIGGNLGSLWVGKQNKWKQLSSQRFMMPWKGMVWYQNRLIVGSDYGLWELREGSLERADVPATVQLCSASLDVSPDGKYLLTGGGHGACLHDGRDWKILWDGLNFE